MSWTDKPATEEFRLLAMKVVAAGIRASLRKLGDQRNDNQAHVAQCFRRWTGLQVDRLEEATRGGRGETVAQLTRLLFEARATLTLISTGARTATDFMLSGRRDALDVMDAFRAYSEFVPASSKDAWRTFADEGELRVATDPLASGPYKAFRSGRKAAFQQWPIGKRLALEAGQLEEYEAFYPILSKYSHPTAMFVEPETAAGGMNVILFLQQRGMQFARDIADLLSTLLPVDHSPATASIRADLPKSENQD